MYNILKLIQIVYYHRIKKYIDNTDIDITYYIGKTYDIHYK